MYFSFVDFNDATTNFKSWHLRFSIDDYPVKCYCDVIVRLQDSLKLELAVITKSNYKTELKLQDLFVTAS